MAVRTARTVWSGSLQEGGGDVSFVSSEAGTFPVSFPRRVEDEANGVTSPEELIGAALASCFSMALSGTIAKAGGTPGGLEVTADVTIGKDEVAGGLRIPNIHLTVVGSPEGMSEDEFVAAAEETKDGCPVSKALTGTEITLDASLKK